MYFAKQVSPEWQEDDLFYNWTDKNNRRHIGFNDDYIAENIIITGNREYLEYLLPEYEKVKELENAYYECEFLFDKHSNHCYWNNWSEFLQAYVSRTDGRKYNTREIHKWKLLIEKYTDHWDIDDIMCEALELITGKKWREITMRGCQQREWQYGYASDELTDKDIEYVEMCYFNTGEEFIVYESKEDFDNEENGCSYYVEDANDLRDRFQEGIKIYAFSGYKHIPEYEEV